MPAGPCINCGAVNYGLSMGGPSICPSCDCGNPAPLGNPEKFGLMRKGDVLLESRDYRQAKVANWCRAAFGEGQASSVQQRGVRLLEEAIEAYQAAGCDPAMAHKLVDFVFSRPAGTVAQELGGVGITVLALANAAGLSADVEEKREVDRVLAKPVEHFTARNQAKNDAGFLAETVPTASERG